MRLALVLVALVGCAGNRLVDLPASDAAKLCSEHPLTRFQSCPVNVQGQCSYTTSSGDCAGLIQSLPASCDASENDYIECSKPACSADDSACDAFKACGIDVWNYVPPTSSCA